MSDSALWSFLTDGMILHPGYPASIQLPHALASAVSFRQSFDPKQWGSVSLWHKVIGAYFCNGYGGSTSRDLFLGVAPGLVASPDVWKYWLASSLLVNYSPGDVVYTMSTKRNHPFRLLMLFGEAVDSATTIAGAFEKGARLHPNNAFAPVVAAGIAALGGSMFRYLERKGRGQEMKAEWTTPTGSIQRSFGYIVIYAFLRNKFGAPFARLWLTLYHCALTIFKEVTGKGVDPVRDLVKSAFCMLTSAKTSLKLGPPPVKDN